MENESKENTQTAAEEKKVNPEAIVEEPEVDYVAEAKKTAIELKAGLEERKKILDREEKLVARQEALRQLGGGSPAGNRPTEHVETSKEYAEKVMTGKIVIPNK